MSDTYRTGPAGPRYADEDADPYAPDAYDDGHGRAAGVRPGEGGRADIHYETDPYEAAPYESGYDSGDARYDDAEYNAARAAPRAPRRHRLQYDPAVARNEDAFKDARRHSRLVRWLRIILPVLALIGAGIFWGTARFIPGNFDELVSVSGIDIESNSVVMQAPQISGFEGTRRAYLVKAENAVQSLSDPKVITFNGIDARIGLDEAGTATIHAEVGVYDGNTNMLTLDKGASMSTTDGYSARFSAAEIDLDAGSLKTDQPLEIGSADGTLRANAARVEDRGKRVTFSNGVSVKFVPPDDLMVRPDAAGGTQ